jgi:hypothetical protein
MPRGVHPAGQASPPPLPPSPQPPAYGQAWMGNSGGGRGFSAIPPQPSPPLPQHAGGGFLTRSPQPDPFPGFVPRSGSSQSLQAPTLSPRLPPGAVTRSSSQPTPSPTLTGLSLRGAINAPQFVPRVDSSSKLQLTPPLQPSASPMPDGTTVSPLLQPQGSLDGDGARPGHLKSTAAPFQPGQGVKQQQAALDAQSAGKLTVHSAPFVPGGRGQGGAGQLGPHVMVVVLCTQNMVEPNARGRGAT